MSKPHRWRGRALPEHAAGLHRFAKEVARCPLRYTDIVAIAGRLPDADDLWRLLCEPT